LLDEGVEAPPGVVGLVLKDGEISGEPGAPFVNHGPGQIVLCFEVIEDISGRQVRGLCSPFWLMTENSQDRSCVSRAAV
jgi:hypothetical protein